jgi:hypothetical protein
MTIPTKTSIEYTILSVPFHAAARTHNDLAQKVKEKLCCGHKLFGPLFLSEEMIYQSKTKPFSNIR